MKSRGGWGRSRSRLALVGALCWAAMPPLLTACASSPADVTMAAPGSEPDIKSAPLLPTPKKSVMKDLLAAKKFDDLERILDQYRIAAIWNMEQGEGPLIQAYRAFDELDEAHMLRLDEWVENRPKSYQAHLARAYARVSAGLEARGGKWAKDTKSEQIDAMHRLLKLAEGDVNKAIELQQQNVAAYRLLLVAKSMVGVRTMIPVAADAVERFPLTYNLRVNLLVKLQPRWGGSYEAMTAVAQSAQRYADKNPKLKCLLGYPDWARGEDMMLAERYEDAYAFFTKALSYGPEGDFFGARNSALRMLDRYPEAFEDAHRYHEDFPWANGDDPADNRVDATTKDAWDYAAKSYRAGKLNVAVATYSALLKERPSDIAALTWRGNSYCRLDRVEDGVADLKRAIEIDQQSKNALPDLAACLANHGQLEPALRFQEQYVANNPEDGIGYFELARLEHGNHLEAQSVRSLRKACDLKYDEACAILEHGKDSGIVAPAAPRWGGGNSSASAAPARLETTRSRMRN